MAEASPAKFIDVFLLAENRLMREALAKVLSKRNDIHVVGASAYDADAYQRVAELKPHVLLFDLTVFTASCTDIVLAARRLVPGLKVVVIGMEADEEVMLCCIRAGVAGFLLRDASAGEIASAVRDVAYEGAVCPPSLCLSLFNHVAQQAPSTRAPYPRINMGLTRREQQLAHLISTGLTNKEIASQLNLSEQTVKNHIHRILRKLGTHNRLGAVELCRQRGVVV